MIYVLTSGHYEEYGIVGVIEGPQEPGFDALVAQFEKSVGVAPPPVREPLPLDDKPRTREQGEEVSRRHDEWCRLYREWLRERTRVLTARFGSLSDYGEAVLKWLCDEHGYKVVEWTEAGFAE